MAQMNSVRMNDLRRRWRHSSYGPPTWLHRLTVARDAVRELVWSDGIVNADVPADLLVYLPSQSFNLEVSHRMVPDKVQPLLEAADSVGLTSVVITDPYRRPFTPPAARQTYGLNRLAVTRFAKELVAPRVSSAQKGHPWTHLSDRIQPSALVGINLSDDLCSEARQRQIPAVEVQHSLIGPWFAQRLSTRAPESRPTHMLTWDSVYETVVEPFGVKALSVGYPLLPTRETRPAWGSPSILVALQYHLVDSIDPYGIMSRDLYSCLRVLERHVTSARFLFRLHPTFEQLRASASAIRWLTRAFRGAHVSRSRHHYVLDDVRAADLVVTHHSSVPFEAALFGVPSIVVSQGFRLAPSGGEAWTGQALSESSGYHMLVSPALEATGVIREADPGRIASVTEELLARDFEAYRPSVTHSVAHALRAIVRPPEGS